MLLLINICITAALVGFIWLIQILVYPSFKVISSNGWSAFHQHHTRAISWIAIPLMLTELFLAIYLVFKEMNTFNSILLAIVIMIWLITFLAAVPLHNRISMQKDNALITKLIRVNWMRTILWTTKFGILLKYSSSFL